MADQRDIELRDAEAAYQRALRDRRGEGLAEAGARLHRLYAAQRTSAAAQPQQLQLEGRRS